MFDLIQLEKIHNYLIINLRMKLYAQWFLTGLALITLMNACLEAPEVDPPSTEDNYAQLDVPSDFEYTTTRSVTFTIETEEKIANVPLRLYFQNPDTEEAFIERAFTNFAGEANFSVEVPVHLDSLYLAVDYIGIPDLFKLNLGGGVQRQVRYRRESRGPSLHRTKYRTSNSGNSALYLSSGAGFQSYFYLFRLIRQ